MAFSYYQKTTELYGKAQGAADSVEMELKLRWISSFPFPLQADFRDSKLPCCPGQSSPLIPAVTLRPLTETISTVQTIYTTRKPVSLAAR